LKRNICAVSIIFIVLLASARTFSQVAREATIEADTKARIVLQSQLSSKLNEVGDHVTAVLYEPIYVNGQMVLARGTEFHGRVTAVQPAKRGMKGAQMAIIFDRLAMPWGEEPVAVELTAIDDWSNDEKLKADDEGKVKGGRNGGKAAENVYRGATIGMAGAGAVILMGGAGAAGGASIAGGLLGGLLLTKGKDVRLEPGAIFRIKFAKPITLPVAQQSGTSPKPIQQEPNEGAQETVKKP
jgi:hypothetical protein